MERVSTAHRLKQIMEERNLKQIDILNLSLPICAKYNIKMNKSDISQYVSGKVEPSQEKLVVLGMALNVAESWLMGFDVAMERKDTPAQAEKDFDILYKFSMLRERDKKIVSDMIDSMLSRKGDGVNHPISLKTILKIYASIVIFLHLQSVLWSSFFVTFVAKNILDCCLESIGAVRFCQWCFAPLCDHAIEKT